MSRPPLLAPGEVAARLEALPGWTCSGDALRREFIADFPEAFAFMTHVTFAAESWTTRTGRTSGTASRSPSRPTTPGASTSTFSSPA
jgi:hypothetical protein